jgi:hypothetical protein
MCIYVFVCVFDIKREVALIGCWPSSHDAIDQKSNHVTTKTLKPLNSCTMFINMSLADEPVVSFHCLSNLNNSPVFISMTNCKYVSVTIGWIRCMNTATLHYILQQFIRGSRDVLINC